MSATDIVDILLGKPGFETPVTEVSLNRHNTKVWTATFTGPYPGQQLSRSTGVTDRSQALAIAQRFEAEAKAQRAAFGHRFRKPTVRVRRRKDSGPPEQLTQREVATILSISVRAVRAAEYRAFLKLRRHPLLRKIWQQHLTGELDEDDLRLTPAEIAALLALARSPTERQVVKKVLGLVQS